MRIDAQCRRKIVWTFIFFFPLFAFAQLTTRQINKLSYPLQKKINTIPRRSENYFFIAGKNYDSLRLLLLNQKGIKILYEYQPSKLFVIRTTFQNLLPVLQNEQVTFVDELRKAKEELAVSNLDLSANKINLVHNVFAAFNGSGRTVSVKENRPDTEDIDFKGRYLSTTLSSPVFSTHASDMATIIGGGGNTFYEGKGVAWGSRISSSGFAVLLPEPDAAYQQYDISVQNHSYGTGIENYYGADAAAYDASVMIRPALFHVFSVGNSGMETDTIGTYKNVTGFANVTGSFKMAKNIITVGHADSLYNVLSPSSRGPAYDGRVRPELVAFAEDGSSGAAAIVSGTALVLQQAHETLKGQLPSAALIKAILLNSADDVGAKGIDFISGYGNVNAYRAMQTLINEQYFTGSLSGNQTVTHNIVVPAGLKQLKITLTWNDPPATPNAAKALINDLDLSLSLPSSGETWLPWVLNSFPDADSLNQLPVRKKDTLNTAEQVTIDNPASGDYVISVKGASVSDPLQDYCIAYQFDSLNKFQWYYPAANGNIFGNRSNVLRWNCSYPDVTGRLEYSFDNGTTWKLIDNSAQLATGYYKWNVPDTFTTALLRMNAAGSYFTSDTFTVSTRFDVHVDFNCTDSFALSWNKIPAVNNFTVYKLGEKYMEPLMEVADTFVVLNKSTNASLYYAVSPVINNKEGVRSYGFNYATQGTGCYIESFLAQLTGSNGLLNVELGTVYHVKSLTWQKLSLNVYNDLQAAPLTSATSYSYTDIHVSKGVNTYRVKLTLSNGQTIYSDPASIYFFGADTYIIFPNPVSQQQSLTVLRNEFEPTELLIFNSAGMKVLDKQLNNEVNTIPVGNLSKGIYFIQILKNGRKEKGFKIFVY